ncbi:MAG TPA: hypothetical protein VKK06_20110 [Terriglobia bacterium]|nr:hypothetical protein [Terriglobia bacterium]
MKRSNFYEIGAKRRGSDEHNDLLFKRWVEEVEELKHELNLSRAKMPAIPNQCRT